MSPITALATNRYVTEMRLRRYNRFMSELAISPSDRILDVGAGSGGGLARFNGDNEIVAVDERRQLALHGNVDTVVGDARALPYPDRAFEVCFSNSVLQYMVADDRRLYAGEIRRVAERYWVQAPYRFFPVDPHYLVPFIQLLPQRAQRWVNGRVRLGWRKKGDWTPTLMPTVREMRSLFPDATITRERFFGLTKSVIAYRCVKAGD